ncbi:MAG: type 1 glutamine amidotransferase [Dongiaceae bacterium]
MLVASRARSPRAAASPSLQFEVRSAANAPQPSRAMDGPRLLVIQHCPVTPIGTVGEFLVSRGAQFETRFPHGSPQSGSRGGEPLPGSASGYDGLIVLGGPQHAGDDEGHPAFRAIMRLIRQFHRAAKPVYGICLGAQLVARAFGEKVYPFGGMEVGFLPATLTTEAAYDPLLAGLGGSQQVMQLHEDTFDLPRGAVRLMANEACPNQAFRLGRSTYGFQFHIEVTERDAFNFPRDCWASMERHYGETAELVERAVIAGICRHFGEGLAFCEQVTGRWFDLVEARRIAGRVQKPVGRRRAA